MSRVALAVALLAALSPVPASGATLTTFPVPTGGFSIDLPTTWVDITKAAPSVLQQLEKVPSFRAFAQAASQNGSLKLIAADPTAGGTVYMNVGAARVGPLTLTQVATATAAALKKTLGAQGSVQSSRVTLGVGPAYRLHLSRKGSPNQTDEYLVLHEQVEYVIVFVAPSSSWAKHEPVFASSARSFRFLPAPDLSRLVLRAAQVGRGYKTVSFPFGTSFIGEPTLDLCAASYPSESLRVGRLQVRYTHTPSEAEVSNEVVRYTSGGAQQALGEVAAVARACAKKPVVLTRGAAREVYKVAPIKDPKLPSGAVAVKLDISVTNGTKRQSQIGVAIYQVKGDTLSGVYTFVGKGGTFAEAERTAFHAAEQSAHNLGSGKTGFTA